MGSDPVSVKVGAGYPVASTVKVPAVPAAKVAELPEVIVGAWSTVSVNVWVALGLVPLAAVMVIAKLPPVPAAGVPESTPLVELRVTPFGSVPDSLKVGAGLPVAVTVKVPADPTVKVVEFAEVIDGAVAKVVTEIVKLWVALGLVPLLAVIVIG